MKPTPIADEINALRSLILRPVRKTPDEAWDAFIDHMRTMHGVTDIESPAGKEYMAEFEKSPGMKALLDYMLRREPLV